MVRDYDALTGVIEARVRTPFAWDDTGIDCVRFADEAVAAQTGSSPLATLAVGWKSKIGAHRWLKRLGGLEAVVDRVLAPSPCALARRGDVALVAGPEGPALMIVEGDSLVGPGERGQIRLPRAAMLKAWSAD
jgi:hypothetical protein